MNNTLAEKTARASRFPKRPVNPQLESRAMKNKQTETKLRSGVGLTRHLISGILCLAAISLICARASAQNLFTVDVDPTTGGFNGSIDEFTPNGVRSIFASGLTSPFALAFDSRGNLFVADSGSGAVYKFTPAGVRTTFAVGLSVTVGLAFDSAGNLFATEFYSGHIYKFTPNGVRSTFASGLFEPQGLAFDRAGNLFVAAGGTVSKFTPTGVHTAFASGLTTPFALAFDSGGNLFVADGGYSWDYPPVDGAVYKFTPTGLRSIFASGLTYPNGLAIDSADNLFVADVHWEQQTLAGSILKITPSGVRTTFASRIVAAMAFQPPPTSGSGQLQNISTRAFVQTGDNVMIGGVIITGSGEKKVILRAIGPSLGNDGITNPLQNPTLELHDHTGAVIASNDNWMGAPNKQEIIDSGLAPSNDLESAILTSLNPGTYTAIVRGVNNGTGIALVEGYDLDPSAGSKLGNISTRTLVQTGDNVMIGGLIITGAGQKEVIVRAMGPSLTQDGITNALADPTLELHDPNGTLLASNDNWKDTQQTEIQATGLAPTNDKESAIVRTLTPGNYTAIVRGVNDGTGVALVEVYGLN